MLPSTCGQKTTAHLCCSPGKEFYLVPNLGAEVHPACIKLFAVSLRMSAPDFSLTVDSGHMSEDLNRSTVIILS